MEERFQYITHKGESIVVMDLSNLQDEKEIVRLLRMSSTLQTRHGFLVDLINTHFTRSIMKEAKENAKSVRPLLKALAVVGTGSMAGVLVSAVSRFSGMKIATFETRGAAKDWLAKELVKGQITLLPMTAAGQRAFWLRRWTSPGGCPVAVHLRPYASLAQQFKAVYIHQPHVCQSQLWDHGQG